ncbi:MAG TPA: HD domain-containing phosphohydrolase, partial [Dehalococcoidia bacterium]|nr:HD domain-containing phosphohydrolase [Dehalococcoidia bacterium]
PAYILQKAEKLTDEEFALIREHPVKGWEIARQVGEMRLVAEVIRHHYERFDGRGYPDGLAGEAIPLEARIVTTADTFDAMTSQRPYRPALSMEAAKEELLRVAGSQLDPQCVQALLKALELGIAAAPDALVGATPVQIASLVSSE